MNSDSYRYFMNLAENVKEKSTCLRHKMGALIIKDENIISIGYNGAPSILPKCTETGSCIRNKLNIPSGKQIEVCKAVHAEQNALMNLVTPLSQGSTLYCTHLPCVSCAKMIINAKINEIVYSETYPDEDTVREMLKTSGVRLTKI